MVYYDHRKDAYVAGLGFPGAGGGVIGFLGIECHYFLYDNLGIFLEYLMGSAYQFSIGLICRY